MTMAVRAQRKKPSEAFRCTYGNEYFRNYLNINVSFSPARLLVQVKGLHSGR